MSEANTLMMPEASFTSTGLMDAAWTLIKTSEALVMVGVGTVAISYLSGVQ